MEDTVYWVIGFIIAASSLMVVISRRAIHSAVYMIVGLTGTGVIYIGMGAEFLGVIQIIVYAGAVMVLFLFVVMLTGSGGESWMGVGYRVFGVGGGLALLILLAAGGAYRIWGRGGGIEAGSNTRQIAEALYTGYILPFEAASVLLLAAIVGAIVLGRAREGGEG